MLVPFLNSKSTGTHSKIAQRCQNFSIESVYGSLHCTVIIFLPSSILKENDNGYQQGEINCMMTIISD